MLLSVVQAFDIEDLGQMDYLEAWNFQREVHAAVASGEREPTLLLCEHPPTLTFGKKGGRKNLIASEESLSKRGFSMYDIERGGDVTYHGPGQLVGYPIFKVGWQVQQFLRQIEDALIDVLASYNVEAVGSPGYAGVWVGDKKVAAIGVAIKRRVSFHGFALNVRPDLSHFETIIPCGIRDKGVTSMAELLGRDVTLEEVKPRVAQAFEKIFSSANV